jgi:hypothetical protein
MVIWWKTTMAAFSTPMTTFNNLSGTPRARSVAKQYAASVGINTEGLRYALPSNGIGSLPSAQLQTYILAHVQASSLPIYQSLFKLYNMAPGIRARHCCHERKPSPSR